jgi:hypothetical protein
VHLPWRRWDGRTTALFVVETVVLAALLLAAAAGIAELSSAAPLAVTCLAVLVLVTGMLVTADRLRAGRRDS